MAVAKQQWSSPITFLLAAIGFSVGLGNIWRFPYIAGENGGGAFVLIYVICVVLIGIPIIIAELAIGRHGRGSAPHAMRETALGANASPSWGLVGLMGVVSAVLILSFYCVIGGWTLYFFWTALTGELSAAVAAERDLFGLLLADPLKLVFWQCVFIGLNLLAVGPGLKSGVERSVVVLMPLLFVLLAGLAITGLIVGDGRGAIDFLFTPDFTVVTGQTWLDALGQAFFSVGVGLGILMTYGASLPRSANLPSTAVTLAFADTLVAVVAGVAIFPFVLAMGLAPAAGPGLVFATMPAALIGLGGSWLVVGFFALLAIAAVTSSIATFHLVASWAEERGVARVPATVLTALLSGVLGLATVFSLNLASGFYPLSFISGYETATMFDLIDAFTAQITMPIGGLLITVFAGWIMHRAHIAQELGLARSSVILPVARWTMRIVVPLAVLAVLVVGLT